MNSTEQGATELNQHSSTLLQRAFAMPVAAMECEDVTEVTMLRAPLPGTCLPPSSSNTCRVCATVTDLMVPIFEGEGLENCLAQKIHQHLPIQVSEDDVLPLVVCFQCTSTLLAWHELVLCSIQADAAMRERFNLQFPPPQQRQEQANVEASHSQDKDDKSQALSKCVKNVLINFESLNVDELDEEDSYVKLVCQKCISKPALTMDDFAKHLQTKHYSEVSSEDAVLNFINDHVTFEEALESDSDREADSVATTEPPDTADAKPLPILLCPHCDSAFSSTTRLTHHLNRHTSVSLEAGVECCAVLHRNRNDFAAHLREKHAKRLVSGPDRACRSCGLTADSEEGLRAHVKEHHGERSDKRNKRESAKNQKSIPAVCPECDETFSNKYNMFRHMRSHAAPAAASAAHRCGRCGRAYSTRGNLAQHERLAHAGLLPHACAACGEAFATRAQRDLHARLHSGARPFRCQRCGKRFRAKNSLDRHTDAHLDVRRHACVVCAKAFRKRSHLAAHARTHRQRQ